MTSIPEIAYPDAGWITRFVGRTEQFEIINRIIQSTEHGAQLPIIQVIGDMGVGKSWFLQRLRWSLRESIDTPSVLLRVSNPAMAQSDLAIEALITKLINRWKMNFNLTEFALGRVAHLKGENFDRFAAYSAAVKILPMLEQPKGENELRRILVERGVDKLTRVFGANWGKRFLSMSPHEISWYLLDLFGMDIDSALRTMRYRAFVLMIDDVDLVPLFYHSCQRIKSVSALTLIVVASQKAMPTGGFPVETIPLEPLPILERRAYFYLLGIDDHRKQDKICRKFGNSSIDFAMGVVEQKQLLDRNPSLKKLLANMLVCRRPSLEILYKMMGDTGAISAFFAESALVDLLEHPDRLPWRFTLHPVARRWALEKVRPLPKPDQPYGTEVVNRLALFANKDFAMGMPVLYWFCRQCIAEKNIGDAIGAIFAADEIVENFGKTNFILYHKLMALGALAPNFSNNVLLHYARRTFLWRTEKFALPEIIFAAKCFSEANRHKMAMWLAKPLVPKISAAIIDSGGKNAALMIFRCEVNLILARSYLHLNELNEAQNSLTRAKEAVLAASLSESALVDEAAIYEIEIYKQQALCYIAKDQRQQAHDALASAIDIATSFLIGLEYKFVPAVELCQSLLEIFFAHGLWAYNLKRTLKWLKKILRNCEHQRNEKENLAATAVEVRLTLFLARIYLQIGEHQDTIDLLSHTEELLNLLGEKMRWKAERWHRLSVITSLLRAEAFVAGRNFTNAFDFAKQALERLMRWELDSKPENIELLVSTRIIGGIALARLERFKDALMWLNMGISAGEKALLAPEVVHNPYLLRTLCGDGYHEIARLEMQNNNFPRTEEMARRGIDHFMEFLSVSDSPDVRFGVVELYSFILEVLPKNDFDSIYETYETAVNVLITGIERDERGRERYMRIAEGLFKFALKTYETYVGELDAEFLLNALSLYPLLHDPELLRKAKSLSEVLAGANLSGDLHKKLASILKFIGESRTNEDDYVDIA